MQRRHKNQKVVLCISGYDTNNFSGNSADCRTCYKLNTYPVSVISAVVSQNIKNVYNIYNVDENSFRSQMSSILEERKVHAVKIGMLFTENFFSIIEEFIKKYSLKNIIYDPVLEATSGKKLIQNSKKKFIKEILKFSKYIDCITPNITEAENILGIRILKYKDIETSLRILYNKGFQNIIIKGGHFTMGQNSTDYWFNGKIIQKNSFRKLLKNNTRATGCTFSTALACYMANNYDMKKSFYKAKKFTFNCLKKGIPLEGLNGGCWQL